VEAQQTRNWLSFWKVNLSGTGMESSWIVT